MVRAEESSESLATLNAIHRLGLGRSIDQPIAESLMVAIQVVVRDIFVDGVPQVQLADGDDLREALLFDRTHESLRVRVEIRTLRRQPNRLDARRPLQCRAGPK